MNFNPVVTADDFAHPADERLIVGRAGQEAVRRRTLAPDITAEHDKLTWADTLIVQFPLWWTAKTGGSTSMPAYHRVPCCRGTGVRSARR
ncbi:Flavodoxin-like fold protein [Streptomyces sp. NP10]|nr:Flavodoxin-like fold protein [Streptomyces sp. NP10]